MTIDLFQPIFEKYLVMKGVDDEETLYDIQQYLSSETIDILPGGKVMSESINLLLYKDIVCGVHNEMITIEQALYQLVNAVDLYLALKGYLYATMDSYKVSTNFREVSAKISQISTKNELAQFYDYIITDTSWIPIQKEYRSCYAFLLINMVSMLVFGCPYGDSLE